MALLDKTHINGVPQPPTAEPAPEPPFETSAAPQMDLGDTSHITVY
jgi:hypothetical protein